MTARLPRGYYDESGDPEPAPKRKARGTLEHGIQVAIVKYLRLALPGAVINASVNGAYLAGNDAERSQAMNKLKAAGMLPGFPDLEILWRGQHWYFEVKGPGGKVSEAQAEVGAMIERNGGRWAVVRSVTEAEECIRGWRGDLP